jgi:hypothetical protein
MPSVSLLGAVSLSGFPKVKDPRPLKYSFDFDFDFDLALPPVTLK